MKIYQVIQWNKNADPRIMYTDTSRYCCEQEERRLITRTDPTITDYSVLEFTLHGAKLINPGRKLGQPRTFEVF